MRAVEALATLRRGVRGLATAAFVLVVYAHRLLLSPLLGPSCRFAPSCSAYALEAVHAHGPWRGVALALRRVLRCHPFHAGGYDPIPPAPGTLRPVVTPPGVSHGS